MPKALARQPLEVRRTPARKNARSAWDATLGLDWQGTRASLAIEGLARVIIV
jgi:hypothetical protein